MSTNYPTSIDVYTPKISGDTVSETHINNVEDAIEALEAKVGADSSAVATSLDYLVKNLITTNRKMWIYANAAPTGWTIYTTAADCVLAAKGGANAYNVTGGDGTLYGTWTQTTHNHAWWYHYTQPVSANDYTYDVNGTSFQIATGIKSAGYWGIQVGGNNATAVVAPSGGGTGILYTDKTGTANTYRPYAAVGIVINKT